jgi:hypothetical protein
MTGRHDFAELNERRSADGLEDVRGDGVHEPS